MNNETIIAVFCYKRAAKLKAAMEALLLNPECARMEVVFFSDGPKSKADEPGVQATRAYIDGLSGFKKIHRQYRTQNLSTGPNFQQGISWLCRHYQQFIVVEDDLVVTLNYLRFMLDGLDFYRNQKKVFTISGFAFPLKTGSYAFDTVMHERFSCYGWASWSNRVKEVVWDEAALRSLLQSPEFMARLDKEGLDLRRILKKQLSGAISTWDIQMQVHVARHQLRVVYPVLSKTSNIGFDNQSTNQFGVDFLRTITDPGTQRNFRFCPSESWEPALVKQLRKPYGLPALATRKIINTVIKFTGTGKKATAV